jgi:hypothetical protein
MLSYSAYGLNLESELDLPELNPGCTGPTDVIIRLGRVDRFQPNVEGRNHRASFGEICLYYEKVGRFSIVRGSEIVVDLDADADRNLLRVCLLGPALAALLHQRGLLVLHGSAINVNGTAVAFLGDKGWGKSTLAAYMQARGHTFLTDDVVALRTDLSDAVQIEPGFPQVKLWPDTAAFLGMDPEEMVCLQPELDKRGHRLDYSLHKSPLRLGCVYVLDIGDKDEIERIRAQMAVMELVRHSYLARFLKVTDTSSSHLTQCGKVVSSVPAYYLRRSPSLLRLPETAKLVEAHAAATVSREMSCAPTAGGQV